jgi:hypothetical protein
VQSNDQRQREHHGYRQRGVLPPRLPHRHRRRRRRICSCGLRFELQQVELEDHHHEEAGGDLATAAFAASLEVLAVNTYKAALAAATANKLGPVPAAGATFVQTAITQHQAALDKWNGVLTSNGKTAVSAPDPKLNATVNTAFGQVTDFGGAAKLALQLEQIAAATYQKAVSSLTGKDAIQLAGSIQIIDMQHQAILNYVLGNYPVPDTFAKTDMAASPS